MEEMKRKRRKFSLQERAGIVSRYKESGKSPQEFCQQEGIHTSTLGNWLHGRGRKNKTSRLSPFVSLEIPVTEPLMQINFPGGRSVLFYAEPRTEFLKSLLTDQ